jgi:Leucine-rich repeat (LRR) protein
MSTDRSHVSVLRAPCSNSNSSQRTRAFTVQSDISQDIPILQHISNSSWNNQQRLDFDNEVVGSSNEDFHIITLNEVDKSEDILYSSYLREMRYYFQHESSEKYRSVHSIFITILSCNLSPPIGLIANALDLDELMISTLITNHLSFLFQMSDGIISIKSEKTGLIQWLTALDGKEFGLDLSVGHNYLCTLYLKYCGNKSVAIEHTWQEYLRTNGCMHLRKSSRGLRRLTENIRKIDETANIRGTIPRQLGYVVGLQEIYARRVGLYGKLPTELGELNQLRVLSMGNNQICGEFPQSFSNLKNLQRIVLHQNKLTGKVPECK